MHLVWFSIKIARGSCSVLSTIHIMWFEGGSAVFEWHHEELSSRLTDDSPSSLPFSWCSQMEWERDDEHQQLHPHPLPEPSSQRLCPGHRCSGPRNRVARKHAPCRPFCPRGRQPAVTQGVSFRLSFRRHAGKLDARTEDPGLAGKQGASILQLPRSVQVLAFSGKQHPCRITQAFAENERQGLIPLQELKS